MIVLDSRKSAMEGTTVTMDPMRADVVRTDAKRTATHAIMSARTRRQGRFATVVTVTNWLAMDIGVWMWTSARQIRQFAVSCALIKRATLLAIATMVSY